VLVLMIIFSIYLGFLVLVAEQPFGYIPAFAGSYRYLRA